MNKKYDIFQVVKEIEEHGETGRAALLLVLDMALQLKEKNDNQSGGTSMRIICGRSMRR